MIFILKPAFKSIHAQYIDFDELYAVFPVFPVQYDSLQYISALSKDLSLTRFIRGHEQYIIVYNHTGAVYYNVRMTIKQTDRLRC